ncbi:MAG: cbb3-type cytochrome c oxidase subunit II, partial [Acidobacteriota bacterium]|nr:cbb3-type cytochrome c oxidase subunit II [Acidobacteriota bacterium]
MNNRGMNNVVLLVGVPFIIYLVLSIAMGSIPGWILSMTKPGPGVQPLSASADRGRDVYVAEGCSYCHTQQVRPLRQDLVFGRPSTAGDYAYSTPELLGSERNGPDLSNIGSRQPSDTWQYIHLYEPRSLVSGSIMPPYPWLFRMKTRADRADVTVAVPPDFAPRNGVIVTTPQ